MEYEEINRLQNGLPRSIFIVDVQRGFVALSPGSATIGTSRIFIITLFIISHNYKYVRASDGILFACDFCNANMQSSRASVGYNRRLSKRHEERPLLACKSAMSEHDWFVTSSSVTP
jgi:hypothetical protein